MKDNEIRPVVANHWRASAAGDLQAEHDIYTDDVMCFYPQSSERVYCRANTQALRSNYPAKPSGFHVKRILGSRDLWITESIITYLGNLTYTTSVKEFRDDKVVRETQYFADPFEAPYWRSQWVERTR